MLLIVSLLLLLLLHFVFLHCWCITYKAFCDFNYNTFCPKFIIQITACCCIYYCTINIIIVVDMLLIFITTTFINFCIDFNVSIFNFTTYYIICCCNLFIFNLIYSFYFNFKIDFNTILSSSSIVYLCPLSFSVAHIFNYGSVFSLSLSLYPLFSTNFFQNYSNLNIFFIFVFIRIFLSFNHFFILSTCCYRV